jgi:hypothetical protein
MWTSWSDLRGRASCGRSWLHGWRPAQERTGRKPSGAGRPQAHDQRLQVRGRDGGRLAMGADGTELMVLIGVGRSGVDRIQPRRLLLAVDAGTVTAVPGTGSYR